MSDPGVCRTAQATPGPLNNKYKNVMKRPGYAGEYKNTKIQKCNEKTKLCGRNLRWKEASSISQGGELLTQITRSNVTIWSVRGSSLT